MKTFTKALALSSVLAASTFFTGHIFAADQATGYGISESQAQRLESVKSNNGIADKATAHSESHVQKLESVNNNHPVANITEQSTGYGDNESQAQGLVSIKSGHSVADTADKLEAVLTSKGMTVFTRIDHAAGAKKVDKELRPTEVVIFGNPKVGTPLMQCAQSVAIDLPQKMLIWQDAQGATWLGYNDPEYLKVRHNIAGCDEVFKKVTGALAKFAAAASQ